MLITVTAFGLAACEVPISEQFPSRTEEVDGSQVVVKVSYNYTRSSSYGINNRYFSASFELDGIVASGSGSSPDGAVKSAVATWQARKELRDGAREESATPSYAPPPTSPSTSYTPPT